MIKDKLDEAHQTNKSVDGIFEFRATAENAYQVINEAIQRIDEIAASANFQGVDDEIKQEGVAIRQVLNQAKEALDSHSDFLDWQQPETK